MLQFWTYLYDQVVQKTTNQDGVGRMWVFDGWVMLMGRVDRVVVYDGRSVRRDVWAVVTDQFSQPQVSMHHLSVGDGIFPMRPARALRSICHFSIIQSKHTVLEVKRL